MLLLVYVRVCVCRCVCVCGGGGGVVADGQMNQLARCFCTTCVDYLFRLVFVLLLLLLLLFLYTPVLLFVDLLAVCLSVSQCVICRSVCASVAESAQVDERLSV